MAIGQRVTYLKGRFTFEMFLTIITKYNEYLQITMADKHGNAVDIKYDVPDHSVHLRIWSGLFAIQQNWVI